MSCDYRIPECNCGSRVNAVCVDYEGNIPECSDIAGTSQRIHAQMVLEDLYTLACDLKNELDVSDIQLACLEHDGTLKDLLVQIGETLCSISCSLGCDDEFSNCQLNYGTLIDKCGAPVVIVNQCEFNQFVLDKLNEIIDNA